MRKSLYQTFVLGGLTPGNAMTPLRSHPKLIHPNVILRVKVLTLLRKTPAGKVFYDSPPESSELNQLTVCEISTQPKDIRITQYNIASRDLDLRLKMFS